MLTGASLARAEIAERERQSAQTLVPLSTITIVVYALLAVAHAIFLPTSYRWIMVCASAMTALCVFAIRVSWRGRVPPVDQSHAWSALILTLGVLNSFAHLYLAGEAKHSTNLALLIIGTGYLLFPIRWYALSLTIQLVGWAVLTLLRARGDDIVHFGTMVVLSMFVSILLYRARLISVRNTMRSRNDELRFRAAFDTRGVGNIILDQNAVVLLANKSAGEIFQCDSQEMTGRSFDDFVAPFETRNDRSPKLTTLLRATRADDREPLPNVSGIRKNGKAFPIRVTVARMSSGNTPEFIANVVDLTEATALQDRLSNTQRLEAIGQVTGAIAHDFNNLLQVIVSAAELANYKLPPDSAARSHLEEILQTSEHGRSLIQRLHAFSRSQAITMTDVDLNTAIANTLELIRRVLGSNIELVFEPDTESAIARVDTAMLEQMLMTLCINSRDAMPQGGTIRVRVLSSKSRKPTRKELRPGHIRFEITDTGQGMQAAVCERVFEPFFTTKAFGNGSGLGLATAYRIVEIHNGEISVTSQPGEGTSFYVDVPVGTIGDDVPKPALSQKKQASAT